MSDLAESMPKERELIAGALRPVEHRLSADDWFDGDPVEIATNAVLPVVADLIADAEKRGAVKALREMERRLLKFHDLGPEEAVREARILADRIESGEVTL